MRVIPPDGWHTGGSLTGHRGPEVLKVKFNILGKWGCFRQAASRFQGKEVDTTLQCDTSFLYQSEAANRVFWFHPVPFQINKC